MRTAKAGRVVAYVRAHPEELRSFSWQTKKRKGQIETDKLP